MTVTEPERVSYKEAVDRGLARLLGDAREHTIEVEADEGGVVLVPSHTARRVLELLEKRDDLYDLLLAITRVATDDGARYSHDEILKELGFTRDDIAAAAE